MFNLPSINKIPLTLREKASVFTAKDVGAAVMARRQGVKPSHLSRILGGDKKTYTLVELNNKVEEILSHFERDDFYNR